MHDSYSIIHFDSSIREPNRTKSVVRLGDSGMLVFYCDGEEIRPVGIAYMILLALGVCVAVGDAVAVTLGVCVTVDVCDGVMIVEGVCDGVVREINPMSAILELDVVSGVSNTKMT